MGHLVVPGDDVRARRPRLPWQRPLRRKRAGDVRHPRPRQLRRLARRRRPDLEAVAGDRSRESLEARREALRMLSDVLRGETIARDDFLACFISCRGRGRGCSPWRSTTCWRWPSSPTCRAPRSAPELAAAVAARARRDRNDNRPRRLARALGARGSRSRRRKAKRRNHTHLDEDSVPGKIEDYALIGRLRDGGAGRPRRLDRLAVLAGVRFRGLLRRAARRPPARLVAHRPGQDATMSRCYRGDTLILETRFETADGA